MINFNRLSLNQKSSLAIGCLLSFEFVLLFFLDKALVDAEHDLWQASIAKAAATETVMLQSAWAECVTSVVTHRFGHREFGVANTSPPPHDTSPYLTRLSDRFRSLRLLLQDIPDSKKLNEILDDAEKRMNRLLSLSNKTVSNPAELLSTVTDIDVGRRETAALLAELQKISDSEVSAVKMHTPRLSRQTVRQLILTGAILNIVVVVLLAIAFNSGIAHRLAVIRKNADRLAHRQKLLAPLDGTDEIAGLDHSFHEMADQLNELDQLKRQFFASISHDIRSPLNSIYATVSILTETDMFTLPDGALTRLKNTSRTCRRVIDIINDLLDLEKIEEGQLELKLDRTNLRACADEAIATLTGLVEQKKIKLISDFSEDVFVNGDTLWLSQVITNLLSNAIKLSPDGSELVVKIRADEQFGKIDVIDQGPGLAPEDQQKIFDWFQQTSDQKRKRGSSGLGLAIARRIIEQHGGNIGVISESGAGADFWFTVPLYSGSPAEIALPSGSTSGSVAEVAAGANDG